MQTKFTISEQREISQLGSTPEEFTRLGLGVLWCRFRQEDGREGPRVAMFTLGQTILNAGQAKSIILRDRVNRNREAKNA